MAFLPLPKPMAKLETGREAPEPGDREVVVRHPDLIAELARERTLDLRASAAHRHRAAVQDALPRWNVRRWLGIRLVGLGQSLGAPLPEPRAIDPCLDCC
jgi:hypothetical protein